MSRGYRFSEAGSGATNNYIQFPPSDNWEYYKNSSGSVATITSGYLGVTTFYTTNMDSVIFKCPITPINKRRQINWTVYASKAIYIIYEINGTRTTIEYMSGTKSYSITLPANSTSFSIGFANSWNDSKSGDYRITAVGEQILSD